MYDHQHPADRNGGPNRPYAKTSVPPNLHFSILKTALTETTNAVEGKMLASTSSGLVEIDLASRCISWLICTMKSLTGQSMDIKLNPCRLIFNCLNALVRNGYVIKNCFP
uniref:Uncharacterized protein n=1 Tax=Romanomermis culicivorax TaxID=13658 RepID=A0A915JHU3_ROMCU